eukprot:gb/GECG01013241.1/.p1 GENE.gb/GECG01013241.1/~~gb/GECG01013241.1/.p1  ORF type:complete len:604 (+),score=51.61 gb/GECG01013241.1/:1-1812(+)
MDKALVGEKKLTMNVTTSRVEEEFERSENDTEEARLAIKWRRRRRCNCVFICSCRWCTRRMSFYATFLGLLSSILAYTYLVVILAPFAGLCQFIEILLIVVPFFSPLPLLVFTWFLWRTSKGVLGQLCLCTDLPRGWRHLRKEKATRDFEIEQDFSVLGGSTALSYASEEGFPESKWNERCNGCNLRNRSPKYLVLWLSWLLLTTVTVVGTLLLTATSITLAILKSRSLPDLSGTQTVHGLHNVVQINRESNGIFHIHGSTVEDVAFAQGFAHAQSRLFQMELQRRIGKGTISEVAGTGGLEFDRLSRTLGLWEAVSTAWRSMQEEGEANALTLRILESYAQGVNAFIDKDEGLPIEFTLLGYKPSAWVPEDSLVWAKMMSWQLGLNMKLELKRFRLRNEERASQERVEELVPPYNLTLGPTILNEEELPSSQVSSSTSECADEGRIIEAAANLFVKAEKGRMLENTQGDGGLGGSIEEAQPKNPWTLVKAGITHFVNVILWRNSCESKSVLHRMFSSLRKMTYKGYGASNSWVIHGNYTESGLPFLSSDPHLPLLVPSLWVLNGLYVRNSTFSNAVVGSSFPGVPSVVLGHNEVIAWGLTNT